MLMFYTNLEANFIQVSKENHVCILHLKFRNQLHFRTPDVLPCRFKGQPITEALGFRRGEAERSFFPSSIPLTAPRTPGGDWGKNLSPAGERNFSRRAKRVHDINPASDSFENQISGSGYVLQISCFPQKRSIREAGDLYSCSILFTKLQQG